MVCLHVEVLVGKGNLGEHAREKKNWSEATNLGQDTVSGRGKTIGAEGKNVFENFVI